MDVGNRWRKDQSAVFPAPAIIQRRPKALPSAGPPSSFLPHLECFHLRKGAYTPADRQDRAEDRDPAASTPRH